MLILFAQLVALSGGTVHSMVPGEPPRVATILVKDGRIEAIGPDLELPAGAERYDLSGLHVVPGLIDGMVRFDPEHDALYVAAGVTTVRDVGGGRVRALWERGEERRDRTPGPTLLTCGAVLDGDPPASSDAAVLRDAHGAEEALPILFDEEVDFLAAEPGLPVAALERAIELAGERGLRVWGPRPRTLGLEETLATGMGGLFFLDALLPEGVRWEELDEGGLDGPRALLAQRGTPLVPMLQATAARLGDQRRSPALQLLPLLGPDYEIWWRRELATRAEETDEERLQEGLAVLARQRRELAALAASGVPLIPGSGAPHPWLFPGQALHLELSHWVRAGLAPADVLAGATREAARVLGIAGERGTIAVGLAADLVCSAVDPTESLEGLASPPFVVVRGRVLTREDLDDLLSSLAEEQREARERLDAPLEVAALELPEGAVVLEGLVESRALDQRLSAERFAVVREGGGRTSLVGRVSFPGGEELSVRQTLDGGKLVEFEVRARISGHEVLAEGLWVAGTMRVRRHIDGVFADNRSFASRPACVDVASVTSLVALGRRAARDGLAVLTFHELLEPDLVRWNVELNEKGDHRVRTHNGGMAFRFDELGAPLLWRSQTGRSLVETRLVEVDAKGGSGYPLPPSKRGDAARGNGGGDRAVPLEAGSGSGSGG